MLGLEVMIHMRVDVMDSFIDLSEETLCDKLYMYHRQNEHLSKMSNLSKATI